MNPLRAGIFLATLFLIGCARPQGRGLRDSDASFKIPAIKEAAVDKDSTAVPQLVRDLSNEDPAVRFYAIEALHRLTGENFGYRYYDEEPERQPAVERWKQWLNNRQN